MRLRPLDSPELIHLVAKWLAEKANYQWLDFGDGRQSLTPEWLKIMTQRQSDVLRAFTADGSDVPIGVVGLSNIDHHFKTARFWVVVGDKSFAARGYATPALSKMLTLAFQDLGLHTVNTWVVEGNPSVRIVKRLNCRFIGPQRQCHYIDGRPYDRLWFDLLASEHKEI